MALIENVDYSYDIEFLYRRELELEDGICNIIIDNLEAFLECKKRFIAKYQDLFTQGMRHDHPDYEKIKWDAGIVARRLLTRYVNECAGISNPKGERRYDKK